MANMQTKQPQSTDMQKTEAQTDAPMERTRSRRVFIPRTDIYERPDALVVVADMPGVDQNSVDVNVEKRVLTIAGRVESASSDQRRLSYAEYQTGDYERSFALSDEVDVSKIEASVSHGVLRIVLPKAAEAQPRRIAVTAG